MPSWCWLDIDIALQSEPILLRLPGDVARRLRDQVPARQRSRFVADLLARELAPDPDDPLYAPAVAAEADPALQAELAEWDATVGFDPQTVGRSFSRCLIQ